MKAREIHTGISDMELKNHKRSWGPSLHFAYTIRVDLENGQVRVISVPHFMVRKNVSGTYTLWPPVHYSSSTATSYCAAISKDDEKAIMSYLEKYGFLDKVGTNIPDPKSIMVLEPDLSPEMPPHVILG